MCLLQYLPFYMRHLQIVKEHVNIRRLVAHINIQIPVLIDRHVVFRGRGERLALGIKNYLFADIHEAAKRSGMLYTRHPQNAWYRSRLVAERCTLSD